jgi:hypothetical protein
MIDMIDAAKEDEWGTHLVGVRPRAAPTGDDVALLADDARIIEFRSFRVGSLSPCAFLESTALNNAEPRQEAKHIRLKAISAEARENENGHPRGWP